MSPSRHISPYGIGPSRRLKDKTPRVVMMLTADFLGVVGPISQYVDHLAASALKLGEAAGLNSIGHREQAQRP
jgi:ATP-dependent phosphoenolpyruvate carboxykinase